MSHLWALLIGIDDYFPDRLPDGTRYPSLHGAVADVGRMALLLRDQAGLEPERTVMLLSQAGEDGAPVEPPDRRPTYANIVAAFKQLALEAKPGDRVYIHYAGHGARRPTQHSAIKGAGAWDEALVPCDIAESQYLLDLELAALVQLLVDSDLLVTVVLDCCHAGGAMRTGDQARPRGVPWVEREERPSAVAEPAVLDQIWRALRQDEKRIRNFKSHRALPMARYALFAACRPDELAFEYPFERGKPQGALTYWLLHTLARYGDELSCGELHQRLVARIRGHFAVQTPMYLGPPERGFLSEATRSPARPSPTALRLGEDGQVLLDVGLATGTKSGDRVWTPQAELAIRRVGATESWAEVIRVLGPGEIEPGARAEVFPLRATVRLLPPEPDAQAVQALARLREALPRNGDGFIALCEDETPDLCVAVHQGRYEIRDPGGDPFPNLRPLRVDAPEAVPEVIRRLEHLSKLRNILTVENPRPARWLGIGLELRAHDLRVDEKVTLRLVNQSNQRLDFAVLNLAPDYSVTQILPEVGSFTLLPLDSGGVLEVALTAWLPRGYEEGQDILKVFATQGAVDFRWLELPPLDRPGLVNYPRIEPTHPLERLFTRLAAVKPAQRGWLNPSEFPEEEWITAQVEIRIRR